MGKSSALSRSAHDPRGFVISRGFTTQASPLKPAAGPPASYLITRLSKPDGGMKPVHGRNSAASSDLADFGHDTAPTSAAVGCPTAP